jgi:predicted transcriptional regulator
MHDDSFLRIGEAARLADLAVETLRRLGRKGAIAEFRDGNGVRYYRLRDVMRLRDERRPRLDSSPPSLSSRDAAGTGK